MISQTQSLHPNTTTTYVVTGTDGNNCSNSDTVRVTVNPLPKITISPDDTICRGETYFIDSIRLEERIYGQMPVHFLHQRDHRLPLLH